MNSVRGDPENRASFERKCGEDGKRVFEPLGNLVAAVREKPVIAHSDSQTGRHPPQNYSDKKRLPGEEKQRHDSAHVEYRHKRSRDPVDFVVGCRLFVQIGEFDCHSFWPFLLFSSFDISSRFLTYLSMGLD